MKKTDLTDFTFLIPIRIDSIIRLENLLMTVDYIRRNFNTHIIILHASKYENTFIPKLINMHAGNIRYLFVEDYDNVFYRTKYLNWMTEIATTPFEGIWDTDVIIDKVQITESVMKLREGFDVVYPYDGAFYDSSDIIREEYFKHRDLRILKRNKSKMGLIYGTNMKGGAMFVNRESYKKSGMENEAFYGWGPEDWERYERWKIMGLKIYIVSGGLYHLTHNRGKDSQYRSQMQMFQSNKEFLDTALCSKEEIEEKLLSKNVKDNVRC